MTTYGYARVSTRGQQRDGNGLEAQRAQLLAAGCQEVVEEAFTGTTTDRPAWDALTARLAAGDALVVCKLDRIARTAMGGCEAVQSLLDRGVAVRVLNMGTLDSTPVGRMMVTVMFAMAEFERDMIVQRTREGREVARQRPGYREGRPRVEDRVGAAELARHRALVAGGAETVREACAALGIGRSSWYKLMRGPRNH